MHAVQRWTRYRLGRLARAAGSKPEPESKLSSDAIDTILRRKKSRNTVKTDNSQSMASQVEEVQPEAKMSIEEIRKLAEKAKEKETQLAKSTNVPQTSSKDKPVVELDYLAHSSQLEEYIRGITPVPETIRTFKYELPIPNIDPGFRGIEEIADILRPLPSTPNMNLWACLPALPKDAGEANYEEFQAALRSKFDWEASLYGENEDVAEYQNRMLAELGEELIPLATLADQKYMDQVRKATSINFNMPGSLELVDPNRFIPDLRPVEEMRYTPQIPISDRAMEEFRKKQEEYHLRKHRFVVKKESVFGAVIFGIAAFVFYKIAGYILDKDEEIMLEYERMKLARIRES